MELWFTTGSNHHHCENLSIEFMVSRFAFRVSRFAFCVLRFAFRVLSSTIVTMIFVVKFEDCIL